MPKRKIPKKLYKRKYRVSVGKLLDKKVNTALEKRSKEIAIKEINKQRKVNLSRKFLFFKYDSSTNEFLDHAPALINFAKVNWGGRMCELTQFITKTDIEIVANVPPQDEKVTELNEALDGDGIAQGASTQRREGRRENEDIYITSISARIRIIIPPRTSADNSGIQNIKMKFAIVKHRPEDALAANLTDPKELLTWKPFGYSPQEDREKEAEDNRRKKRTLARGKYTINLNNTRGTEAYRIIYTKLKKPIHISFKPADQNGTSSSEKIYFVARSTVPTVPSYDSNQPSIHVCTKLRYYEQ